MTEDGPMTHHDHYEHGDADVRDDVDHDCYHAADAEEIAFDVLTVSTSRTLADGESGDAIVKVEGHGSPGGTSWPTTVGRSASGSRIRRSTPRSLRGDGAPARRRDRSRRSSSCSTGR